MESGSLAVVAAFGALALVLVVLLVRTRAESRRSLAAARAATADLAARVEELSARLEQGQVAHGALPAGADPADERAYVITDAGSEEATPVVPDRLVLSATVGEPLVRVVAFGHGVRRALSAQSRNRIWFEMRQEMRASRRRRRREDKAFVREARAAQRAERPDAAA